MERRYLAARVETSLARNHNVSLIKSHIPPRQAPRLPGRVSYIRKATTRPETRVIALRITPLHAPVPKAQNGQNFEYLASMACLISGTNLPCLYMAYASSVMSRQMLHPAACLST